MDMSQETTNLLEYFNHHPDELFSYPGFPILAERAGVKTDAERILHSLWFLYKNKLLSTYRVKRRWSMTALKKLPNKNKLIRRCRIRRDRSGRSRGRKGPERSLSFFGAKKTCEMVHALPPQQRKKLTEEGKVQKGWLKIQKEKTKPKLK